MPLRGALLDVSAELGWELGKDALKQYKLQRTPIKLQVREANIFPDMVTASIQTVVLLCGRGQRSAAAAGLCDPGPSFHPTPYELDRLALVSFAQLLPGGRQACPTGHSCH